MALAAAAWLCATWHVYLLNGLSDEVEDRGNGSTRPLAGGELDGTAARTVLGWLAAAAVGLAVFVGLPLVLLVLAMLGLGRLYSAGPRPQKARVGGAMAVIATGGAVTYLAGWYVGGGRTPTSTVLVGPSPAVPAVHDYPVRDTSAGNHRNPHLTALCLSNY
jgi:4-hydroxybenzoate polyprenyltransferase